MQNKKLDFIGLFCEFSVDLLKRLLCLSRVEHILIPLRNKGWQGVGEYKECKKLYSHMETSPSSGAEIAITEGSEVRLVLSKFPRSYGDVVYVSDDTSQSALKSSAGRHVIASIIHNAPLSDSVGNGEPVVLVHVPGEVEISPGMTENVVSSSIRVINVSGVNVGDATLKISYRAPPSAGNNYESVDDSYFVRLRVIPRIPISSSAVHELIGLVEASYMNLVTLSRSYDYGNRQHLRELLESSEMLNSALLIRAVLYFSQSVCEVAFVMRNTTRYYNTTI